MSQCEPTGCPRPTHLGGRGLSVVRRTQEAPLIGSCLVHELDTSLNLSTELLGKMLLLYMKENIITEI